MFLNVGNLIQLNGKTQPPIQLPKYVGNLHKILRFSKIYVLNLVNPKILRAMVPAWNCA